MFLFASWRSPTKRAASGSGSLPTCHRFGTVVQSKVHPPVPLCYTNRLTLSPAVRVRQVISHCLIVLLFSETNSSCIGLYLPLWSIALKTVLRIRDVNPGSRILSFTHPGSRIPGPKTATKERGEKKFVVIPFFVATNFTKKIHNYEIL